MRAHPTASRLGPSPSNGGDSMGWQSNFSGDVRRSGDTTPASSTPRPKTVCTNFLYGQCSRSAQECRFDHPTGLANVLVNQGGAVANVSSGRSNDRTSSRPHSSRPTSPSSSRPNSPLKGALKSALGKRPGSPAAPSSSKIRFGNAYTATYEEEQEKYEEQQDEGLYRR